MVCAMRPKGLPLLHLASLVALGSLTACAPLVRVGDIEPPEGSRVLVEVAVRPQRPGVPTSELAAAMDATAIAALATAPAPAVPSSEAESEMGSSVQGLSVPAEDALADEAELATDARRLESIYMARGYYRARTVDSRLVPMGTDRARAVFELVEQRPTVVSEIRFRGACEPRAPDAPPPETQTAPAPADPTRTGTQPNPGEPDPEAERRKRELCEQAEDLIELRVGDVWEEQVYASGLGLLERAFRAQGFIHTRVTGDTFVSLDQGKAAVWYQIEPGPLVRVRGEVRIEGTQRVRENRIRRRIDIVAGDILDTETLRRTERNVAELGPFFAVQAQPVRSTGRSRRQADMAQGDSTDTPARQLSRTLPVKVQVAEAPRWELTVGPSFVTDFIRLDIALPTRFAHRNLFDELVSLDARAKPALVFPDCFTGKSCLDQTEFGLDSRVTLQVPSFFEEYLRFSVDATYRRDPTQDTKSQEVGGSLGLSRRLTEGLTARLGYNLAFFNYFDSGALGGLSGADALAASELRFETQDLLAWLDASLVLDLRDNPLDAQNGFYGAFTANFAGAGLGSDVGYTRLIGELRGFYTPRFLPMLSFAARLKVGWNFVDQSKGTPQPARFRSGGATTMRGFATDRLGDYVCAVPDADGRYINNPDCGDGSSQRTYIGGNYAFESNFEVRLRFRSGLGLVFFTDVGRVFSREEDVSLDRLYVALGPGLRYDLPVGPIRFDLGFLLGKERATELHFSLGQAF
jgi:outer membrane protein assembly factor BamA